MIPDFIKVVYRLFKYQSERKRQRRDIGIRKKQNASLKANFQADSKKLIVFLIPGAERETGKNKITGGLLSIVSIYEETKKMTDVHSATTILCTPNDEFLLLQNEKIGNDSIVYRFSQLKDFFKPEQILIHIPELFVSNFVSGLKAQDIKWLKEIGTVHINIMNQNIVLMPEAAVIRGLGVVAQNITITTAHQKYCTKEYRAKYGVSLHKLSVWISPEQYTFRNFEEKEELIVVSPDPHPLKEKVLAKLAEVPGLKTQIIQNLSYAQYKELISRAKWSLTFGEGLDGYLIEPVFSGALSFAVYNSDFFTEDFKNLPTLYQSYEEMNEKIIGDLLQLDNCDAFNPPQQQLFQLCAKYYNHDQYRGNIRAFYEGNYTFK